MKNYITLYTATEEREECQVTIDKQFDVALTMLTEIEGTKKTEIIHDLLKTYINKHITATDIPTLAEYSQRRKKTDTMSQQLARLVAMEKVMETAAGTEKTEEENEVDD